MLLREQHARAEGMPHANECLAAERGSLPEGGHCLVHAIGKKARCGDIRVVGDVGAVTDADVVGCDDRDAATGQVPCEAVGLWICALDCEVEVVARASSAWKTPEHQRGFQANWLVLAHHDLKPVVCHEALLSDPDLVNSSRQLLLGQAHGRKCHCRPPSVSPN